MRTLNIVFEDREFRKLESKKGDLGWREFILTLLETRGDKCLDAGNVGE